MAFQCQQAVEVDAMSTLYMSMKSNTGEFFFLGGDLMYLI